MTIEKYLDIFQCLQCAGDLSLSGEFLRCLNCGKEYPRIEGIFRFVDASFYALNEENDSVESKTKNYFGYEWDRFKDWGFIPDQKIKAEEKSEWYGGTVDARQRTFETKCRLSKEDLQKSRIILDAGCGNGRYVYEAAVNTDNLVIGVDIGYGAVRSAYENTKKLDNVLIIQGSLFSLPFKSGVIDASFSNGVLMHTGDARRAFDEISRVIKPTGLFVAHLYHKLNFIWEFDDWLIRKYTTRLSIEEGLEFSRRMKDFAKLVNRIPYGLRFFNLFFRLQPTLHHMFDWYMAPVASHHTYPEVEAWFAKNHFEVIDAQRSKHYPFKKPWALNIKGKKVT